MENCEVLSEQIGSFSTFKETLIREAYRTNTPISVSFELTPRCNLCCKMCYVHLEDDQIHKPTLTTHQWIKIIDEAFDCGLLFATLTGGEALLHPGFEEIYNHLFDLGIFVTIKTNGVLLTEKIIELFTRRKPYCVTISVYGGNEDSYEAVTGKRVFSIVDKNIQNAKRAGIPIKLALTTSKYLDPFFDQTLSYIAKTGLHFGMSTFLIDARPETGRHLDEYGLSTEKMVEAIKAKRKSELTITEERRPEPLIIDELQSVPLKGLRCSAGRTGCSIEWDGIMRACMGVNGGESYPLEVGFQSSWKILNEAVRNASFPQECASCNIRSKCSYCPSQHKSSLNQLAVDPEICENLRILADA